MLVETMYIISRQESTYTTISFLIFVIWFLLMLSINLKHVHDSESTLKYIFQFHENVTKNLE